MPKVYNKRDYCYPNHAKYVGRPTDFGNPFVVGRDGAQGECVELYRNWIWQPEQTWLREKIMNELRGKDLICWCKPKICHADIILEIANCAT